jgi:hypothetical protein
MGRGRKNKEKKMSNRKAQVKKKTKLKSVIAAAKAAKGKK